MTAPFSIGLALLAYFSMNNSYPDAVKKDVYKILFIVNLLHSLVVIYSGFYSSIRILTVPFALGKLYFNYIF